MRPKTKKSTPIGGEGGTPTGGGRAAGGLRIAVEAGYARNGVGAVKPRNPPGDRVFNLGAVLRRFLEGKRSPPTSKWIIIIISYRGELGET